MAQWYAGPDNLRAPTASPLFADLSGVPPLLTVVGGDEVLYDDSSRIVDRWSEGGGVATLHTVGGMQHVFPIWVGVFPEAGRAMDLIGRWIEYL